MKLVRISKDLGEFCAAHMLPHHDGPCRHLHGHNYRVVVTVEGPIQTDTSLSDFGMVLDFSVLKKIYMERIHAIVDHSFLMGTWEPQWILELRSHGTLGDKLGKIACLPIATTTAEFLALWILSEMNTGLKELPEKGRPVCASVRLYETASSYAEVSLSQDERSRLFIEPSGESR